jgi:hypothetical protein
MPGTVISPVANQASCSSGRVGPPLTSDLTRPAVPGTEQQYHHVGLADAVRHTCCGLLGDAPKSSAAITVYPRVSAASRTAARCSSMPAITELMNTFTLVPAALRASLTPSPPWRKPPRLRPDAIEMPLAGAPERQIHTGAGTERQFLDVLLVRPPREALKH